jgi:hypothetical protein
MSEEGSELKSGNGEVFVAWRGKERVEFKKFT